METLLCRRTWPPFPSHPVVVSLWVSSSLLSASCKSGVLSCLSAATPRRPQPWLCTPRLLGRVERLGGWGWSVPGEAFCMSFLGSSPFLGTWERQHSPHRAGSAGLSRVQTSVQCVSSWWGCSNSSPFSTLLGSVVSDASPAQESEAGFPASSCLPCLRGSGD